MILATGGAGNIYPFSTNPADVTGDGYALALEAGAELVDMAPAPPPPITSTSVSKTFISPHLSA